MQSVEHLVEQSHIARESKELLRSRLGFEQYQQDFQFTEEELRDNSFLDVGAGDGSFIHYVRNHKGNDHAYAMDTESRDNVPYYTKGDITSIPYPDQVFDKVVSRNVIHGLMLQKEKGLLSQAIKELIRVTKNSGVVLYSVHDPEVIVQKIANSSELSDEQKKSAQLRFTENRDVESKILQELELLGHRVEILFQNNRRVVSITLRAVQ